VQVYPHEFRRVIEQQAAEEAAALSQATTPEANTPVDTPPVVDCNVQAEEEDEDEDTEEFLEDPINLIDDRDPNRHEVGKLFQLKTVMHHRFKVGSLVIGQRD